MKFKSNNRIIWSIHFFSDRHQWVNIFYIKSGFFLDSSGVPQVYLSPKLFSLFINNFNRELHHYHFLCFSDHIKLYLHVCTLDNFTKLQLIWTDFLIGWIPRVHHLLELALHLYDQISLMILLFHVLSTAS